MFNSVAPNPLKIQREFLNAAYMVTPRWRMRGEVSREKQSNEVFTENNIGINGADLTASYVTPADNQVGVNLRSRGRQLSERPDGGNRSYRQ